MTCACGVGGPRPICAFCRKTVDLIKSRRCVACTAPVFDGDTSRIEGRCAECRSRNVVLSAPTRRLLHLAANARYYGYDSPLSQKLAA